MLYEVITEHDNQRKHKQQEQKQIKIKSFRIDPHDVEIKQRSIRKFIETGHRVLIVITSYSIHYTKLYEAMRLLNSSP